MLRVPDNLAPEFLARVYESPNVPTKGSVSLEGQATSGHNFSDPRTAFAITQMVNGSVTRAIMPSGNYSEVDPLQNIHQGFPPTFIVHGVDDRQIPIQVSRNLLQKLRDNGVQSEMVEIPGEGHTFAAKMVVNSQTWNLQRKGFDFLEKVISGIEKGH